jgi:hypothetical protein
MDVHLPRFPSTNLVLPHVPYSNGRSGTPVPDNIINGCQTGSACLFRLLNYPALYKLLRSDSGYYTRFRQNSEVKHLWAIIVLGWVTSWEVPVLHPLFLPHSFSSIHSFPNFFPSPIYLSLVNSSSLLKHHNNKNCTP